MAGQHTVLARCASGDQGGGASRAGVRPLPPSGRAEALLVVEGIVRAAHEQVDQRALRDDRRVGPREEAGRGRRRSRDGRACGNGRVRKRPRASTRRAPPKPAGARSRPSGQTSEDAGRTHALLAHDDALFVPRRTPQPSVLPRPGPSRRYSAQSPPATNRGSAEKHRSANSPRRRSVRLTNGRL